jgi:hypothetical protein
MSAPAEPFTLPESDTPHTVGDPDCDACWRPPVLPHECDIPGCLQHNSFGDENYDGDYWLYYRGDLCREP